MTPPGKPMVPEPAPPLQESGRARAKAWLDYAPGSGFREAKSVSAAVLLDFDAVVHLIDSQDLRVAAVASQLVVLAHDQGLDRLGRTDFGTQATETAAREVEVEVVED